MQCKVLHLLMADMRISFREAGLTLYLIILVFVSCLVFLVEHPYSYLYVVMMLLSQLVPQLPKFLYVLPLDNKTLRRYIHLRCLFSALLMLSTGGIFTLISLRYPIPHLEQGWRMLSFITQLCLMVGLYHTKAARKHMVLIYSLCGLLLLGNLVNLLFVSSFKLQMAISAGCILASDLFLAFCLRSFRLGNYTEPIYGYMSFIKGRNSKKPEGGRLL